MGAVYFDNNASTPVLAEVCDAIGPALRGELGNASSIHQRGQAAKAALERARTQVADLIAADPAEIVFTSGGTESDNLAIFGAVGQAPPAHVVTTRIEHHAVLNACEELQRRGHEVTYVGVDRQGRVSVDAIAAALRPETALISVMSANNETGVEQPVADVALMARQAKVLFHVDAIQSAGKVPIDVGRIGCDLLSLSGHKFHAPAGVGALYVRRGVRLHAQIFGGRHERERRAGSENLPGIIGMGAAAALARGYDSTRVTALRDRLEAGVLSAVPDCGVVGEGAPRVGNTANIWFDGIEGEALVIALDLRGFCVSTGAACSSGVIEPSHVLLAMGYSKARARGCVRFSLGRRNTAEEVDALLAIVPELVAKQRRLAPRKIARTA
ncbi:MAG TPA: cysteine desulfurase family protein [Terriglobales bacterium]|nr:cysteine desulfurase family protein [Terriglobales bacterium]